MAYVCAPSSKNKLTANDLPVFVCLGIILLAGCSSELQSKPHVLSVQTGQFLLADAQIDTPLSGTASRNEELLSIFQQHEASLPKQYLYGFSGTQAMILLQM